MQFNSSYKIVDFFDSFVKKNNGRKNPHVKTSKEFNRVIRAYNDLASTQIVEKGSHYFPKIGKIKIVKFKNVTSPVDGKRMPVRRVDHLESKKQKKTVYYMNSHTEGYVFKTFWVPSSPLAWPKAFYAFHASRKYNREKKARSIKNGKMDYPTILTK